jgi:hypothetical protein
MTKTAGSGSASGSESGSGSGSGSISQRHRSADPDPDPHQNVMDPEHWIYSRHLGENGGKDGRQIDPGAGR